MPQAYIEDTMTLGTILGMDYDPPTLCNCITSTFKWVYYYNISLARSNTIQEIGPLLRDINFGCTTDLRVLFPTDEYGG